jgi:hypoxanthine phosphoribosyltransferase
MSEHFNIIVTKEQIDQRVTQLAEQISSDYEGKTLDVICLVNSAMMFTADLVRQLTIPTRLHVFGFTSYPQGNETGEIRVTLDVPEPLFDRHVLVVEGIVISGRTPRFVRDLISNRAPASIAFCALGTKPHLLTERLTVEYVGFELGREIMVGYGVGSGPVKTLPYLVEK